MPKVLPFRALLAWCVTVAWGAEISLVRAEDATPVSQQYVLRVWDTEDGLPHSSVSGIAQTPDGYLWLATREGLARFDGTRFTTFHKGNVGLESVYVRTVATDRSGELWLGLQYGGVTRLHQGKFETIIPPASPMSATAWTSSFAQDAGGAMWIGQAPERIARRWSSGKVTVFTAEDGIGAGKDTFVHADTGGRIWYNTANACGIFDGARFREIAPEDGGTIHMSPARSGGMWAARDAGLIHYFADGKREKAADLAILGGPKEVTALLESRENDLWIGTRGAGLWRLHDGKFTRVPTSRPAVQAVMQDREGNLWVGLLTGGLNRLRPQRFVLHDTSHGLPKEGGLSLVKDTADRIWVAVRDTGPVRSLDGSNQSFAPITPWPGSLITTMYPDPAGGVWIGQYEGTLLRWKDGVFTETSFKGSIASLLRDREGNVWIATEREGVYRWHDESATQETTGEELRRPRALAQDSSGAIWAGTEDGLLFRRQEGRFAPVDLAGLTEGNSIRFIVADGPETVWIGSRYGRMWRWHSGRIDAVPPEAGLAGSDLRALLIDTKGNFWLARGRGLMRTTRESMEEVLSGKERTIRRVLYSRDEGLPSGGFTFGRRNATAETRDGHLWFATDRGCVEVNPENQTESVPLLPVLIEEMRVHGEVVAPRAALKLPPRPGPIEIRYTLPLLKAGDRLHFRYRLVGLDEGWVDAENQRVASFAHLPPGAYRFEVAARETDAPESSEVVARLPFTVRAAWWETAWFQGSMMALGALALAALVRMIVLRRVRARMRALEQQHALEKERARIARDMHDDLGASLTQITLASQLARLSPAAEVQGHIDDIADIARRTVTALDEIVWMVNPRNDTLNSAVEYLGQHAVDFLTAADIACELEIPYDLPASPLPTHARHHLFLVVKEALNNVVKHAGATTVQFKAEVNGSALRLVIADNGHGFAMGQERAGSDGLHNMGARMAELGGTCRIDSQPGAGTRVTFEMQLSPNGP